MWATWVTDLNIVQLQVDGKPRHGSKQQFNPVNILAPGVSTGHSDHDGSGSSVTTRPQVSAQTPGFMWPLVDINTDLSCSLDLVVTITLGGRKGHPDLHRPYGPQILTQPQVVVQASEISTVLDGKRSHGYQH